MNKTPRNVTFVILGIVVIVVILLFRFCSPKTEPPIPQKETSPQPVEKVSTPIVNSEGGDDKPLDVVTTAEPPKREVVQPSRVRVPPKKVITPTNEIPPMIDSNTPSSDSEVAKAITSAKDDDTTPTVVEKTDDADELPIVTKAETTPSSTTSYKTTHHIVFLGGGLSQYMMSSDSSDNFYNVFCYNVGYAYLLRPAKSPAIVELGGRLIDRSSGEFVVFGSDERASTKVLYSLQYLDIFAKAKWGIRLDNNLSLQPFAGYAASILLFANNKGNANPLTKSAREYYGNVYPVALLGCDIVVYDKYSLGLEHNIGISNIFITGKDHDARTSSTFLNIGYRFK